MYRIQTTIHPDSMKAELISHGSSGAQEGIKIMFGESSPEKICNARLSWFDGQVIDLDALQGLLPGIAQLGWATGKRNVAMHEEPDGTFVLVITP